MGRHDKNTDEYSQYVPVGIFLSNLATCLFMLVTGAITGLVDRLEKAGFVRRDRDPSDRHKVVI